MRLVKKTGQAVALSMTCAFLLVFGTVSAAAIVAQEAIARHPILDARHAAFNSGDLGATLALFADDAVLVSGTRRVRYSGKEEIRRQLQDQIARNQREFAEDRHVEGNRVVQTVRISRDDWRSLGIDSLWAVQDVVVQGGLIRFFDTNLTVDSQTSLELAQSAPGILWVTNRSTNDVTAFRAGSGEVITTIPVGSTPIGITAPRGTGKVYVSDEGSNQVSVISKESMSVVATIPTGPLPHHVADSPDGRHVYVALFGANQIAVIDTATDTLVAEFTTGAPVARTHAPWVAGDGASVFATNSVVDEIVALDARTGAIQWVLPVGLNPSEVLVPAGGDLAFVSIRNEDKIQLVDLTSRAILDEFFVGAQPDTLQLTPDGRLLAVGLRGTPAQLAIVEIAESASVSWVDIEGTTTGHNVLSPDGRYSFIAIEGDAAGVAVVDNPERRVVTTYAYPGGGRPHGVFYDPSPIQ